MTNEICQYNVVRESRIMYHPELYITFDPLSLLVSHTYILIYVYFFTTRQLSSQKKIEFTVRIIEDFV